MKAITLIQPWATLIALEEKQIETRSWSTAYRGELAIHAGKKVDREVCEQEPFKTILKKHGYTADNLPTGCVIAICNLTNCLKANAKDPKKGAVYLGDGDKWLKVEGNEIHFGDYTIGRYGWILNQTRRLEKPIPAKGALSLWEWGNQP